MQTLQTTLVCSRPLEVTESLWQRLEQQNVHCETGSIYFVLTSSNAKLLTVLHRKLHALGADSTSGAVALPRDECRWGGRAYQQMVLLLTASPHSISHRQLDQQPLIASGGMLGVNVNTSLLFSDCVLRT